MQTLKKGADQVPEIMAQHVLEGQLGVFLAALYQLICTQQQGITSMVVAQAGVPVHLGINNWATTASMTRLFAQVIPGLGSLHRCTSMLEQIKYMPIPPKGPQCFRLHRFPGSKSRWKAQLPTPSTSGMRLILGYHQWAGPPWSRLWSRVWAATANPSPVPLS